MTTDRPMGIEVTLEPCPFCGFDSQCLTTVTTGAGMFDALQCQNCGATGPYNLNDVVPGNNAARWNSRHRQSSIASLTGGVGTAKLHGLSERAAPAPWVVYSEPEVGLFASVFSGTVMQTGFAPVNLEDPGNVEFVVEAVNFTRAAIAKAEVREQMIERLRIMSKQRTSSQMDEHEQEGADWQGAYDWFCDESRAIYAALTPSPLTIAPDAVREADDLANKPVGGDFSLRAFNVVRCLAKAEFRSDVDRCKDEAEYLMASLKDSGLPSYLRIRFPEMEGAPTTPPAKDDAGTIEGWQKPYADAGHDVASVFNPMTTKCKRCGTPQIDLSEDLVYGPMRQCRAALSPQSDEGEERHG